MIEATQDLASRRVRHEAVRRPVTVVGVEPVGANSLSVTFEGAALAGFTSLGFDDHCKFIFEDAGGEEAKRDFTPRRFDPHRNWLTLEFALHEGGAASEWAERALPGSAATIGGPKSSVVVPTGYAWHLLAGDPTAAPAIARRLEELPEGTRAIAILLDPAGSGDRLLSSRAEMDVRWTKEEGAFVKEIRSIKLPEGPGFVWCAGEAGLMAQLRNLFVTERQHPRSALRIAGYWKLGSAGVHETIESSVA
jgi:NADPH-dependent ferric siderophore reductase